MDVEAKMLQHESDISTLRESLRQLIDTEKGTQKSIQMLTNQVTRLIVLTEGSHTPQNCPNKEKYDTAHHAAEITLNENKADHREIYGRLVTLEKITESLRNVSATVEDINTTVNQVRGGFRVALWVIAIVGPMIGAVISWLISHFIV